MSHTYNLKLIKSLNTYNLWYNLEVCQSINSEIYTPTQISWRYILIKSIEIGIQTLMVCLLDGLGNENETYVYLTKCNLWMRIKYVSLTQFGNNEWESHSHGGLWIKMREWEWNLCTLLYPSNFFIFSKLSSFKS